MLKLITNNKVISRSIVLVKNNCQGFAKEAPQKDGKKKDDQLLLLFRRNLLKRLYLNGYNLRINPSRPQNNSTHISSQNVRRRIR